MSMVAKDAHARLAPSAAFIWGAEDGCRRYPQHAKEYPDPEDSEEAREGTAAHWYVAELLNGRDVSIGATDPGGYPINAEMVDCAQGILIDVRDAVSAAQEPVLWVEQKLYMSNVHASDNWGTPDVVLVDAPQRHIHIWDYKYGHRFIDAVGNLQLMDYAVGALEALGLNFTAPKGDPASVFDWVITFNIAQPRNYDPLGPIRYWRLTGSQIRDQYLPQLKKAAWEASQPGAPFTTGEHCRDCSGRHACPALQQAGALALDVSLQSQAVNLPPHAVGLELRQLEDAIARLKARKTGLEAQALGLIRGGTTIPFYTAEHASGREKWDTPAPEVFALGDNFGVDLRKPQEPITPNQARQLGVDAEVIKSYASRPMGAVRLKKADDNAAKLAFE